MNPYNPKARKTKSRRPHPIGRGPMKKAPPRIIAAIAVLVSVAWVFERCHSLESAPDPNQASSAVSQ